MIYEVSFCKSAGNIDVSYDEFLINMLINCQLNVSWEDYVRKDEDSRVYYKYKEDDYARGKETGLEGFEI